MFRRVWREGPIQYTYEVQRRPTYLDATLRAEWLGQSMSCFWCSLTVKDLNERFLRLMQKMREEARRFGRHGPATPSRFDAELDE